MYIFKVVVYIIRMVNYLNQTTSFPNISLFLVSCIQCCLGLWHISRSGNIEFDFIGNLVVLYGWPFIVAWCSSEIESASDRLTIAPFESNWYKLKPRVRKYFIVYLTMCNQDIRVAYRTIFPINLQQLIWVLQYSYSFYTVVAR